MPDPPPLLRASAEAAATVTQCDSRSAQPLQPMPTMRVDAHCSALAFVLNDHSRWHRRGALLCPQLLRLRECAQAPLFQFGLGAFPPKGGQPLFEGLTLGYQSPFRLHMQRLRSGWGASSPQSGPQPKTEAEESECSGFPSLSWNGWNATDPPEALQGQHPPLWLATLI